MYIEIGKESMHLAQPVEAVISQRMKEKKQFLTTDEFHAIAAF